MLEWLSTRFSSGPPSSGCVDPRCLCSAEMTDGVRPSAPAEDHHPGERSSVGVRLAVDRVGQQWPERGGTAGSRCRGVPPLQGEAESFEVIRLQGKHRSQRVLESFHRNLQYLPTSLLSSNGPGALVTRESKEDTVLTACSTAASSFCFSASDRPPPSTGIQVWILIGCGAAGAARAPAPGSPGAARTTRTSA
ncbi:hypothetical protein EYF80_017757 [Liparis tanakae]|uniref:Uncharacterized protein n=1 Tax=Liparis tanakae TaxID=230148 RepID=A0A4Z2I1L9_9TELE|nr:hypothetical protein EYF80_017757 [Liparis tanakae]